MRTQTAGTSSLRATKGTRSPCGAVRCVCAALKWDDWPASAEDYDLYLTRSPGGEVVSQSTGPQTGLEPPSELACLFNSSAATETYAIGIRAHRVTTRPVRFDLFVYPGPDLEYQVAEGSVTEPGTSPSALTVGAVCWRGSDLESYSSQGPTIGGPSSRTSSAPTRSRRSPSARSPAAASAASREPRPRRHTSRPQPRWSRRRIRPSARRSCRPTSRTTRSTSARPARTPFSGAVS